MLEIEFNRILNEEFYGSFIDSVQPTNWTEEWWKNHGDGIAKQIYDSGEGSIVWKAKERLVKLLELSLAEGLSSNDPFIREYTRAWINDSEKAS